MIQTADSISNQRIRSARIFVIILFLTLRAGDVGLWMFSVDRANPIPAMPGLVVGSVLVTTALLIALWRRSTWARYILMLAIWVFVAAFSAPGIMLVGGTTGASRSALVPLMLGLLAYVAVNVALMQSRRLHRLGHARSCGE